MGLFDVDGEVVCLFVMLLEALIELGVELACRIVRDIEQGYCRRALSEEPADDDSHPSGMLQNRARHRNCQVRCNIEMLFLRKGLPKRRKTSVRHLGKDVPRVWSEWK